MRQLGRSQKDNNKPENKPLKFFFKQKAYKFLVLYMYPPKDLIKRLLFEKVTSLEF